MQIRKEIASAIASALSARRKDETFERTFGKVVRKRHLPFADYIEAMGMIRERSRSDHVTLEEAASLLASEIPHDEGNDQKD